MPQDRNISTTFLKGLDIIRAFGDSDTDLTQAELAKRTGYDRATVRRMCLTLVKAGFANQSERGFCLSPRVLTIAGNFLRANEIGFSVQPVLNEQAEALGREINLYVRDGDRVLYVAQSTSPSNRIRLGLTIGSTLPLLSTASGRMILASLSEERQKPLIETAPLSAHTHATCLNRDIILQRVIDAERQQLAVTKGEYETGICGIAVPVRHSGAMRAVVGSSLALSAPNLEDGIHKTVEVLRVTAAMLGRLKTLEHW